MSETKLSRRDFINLAWGAAGVLAVSELGIAGLRFLSPRATEGEFGGEFNLGPRGDYPPGSVTPVEAGRFYLACLSDGGLLAIYRRCTHLGCAVPFDQAAGQFICPCHGSAFSPDGDVLNEPAPRPLDLFQLSINEDDEIIVDTSTPIERDHPSPEHVVYA
ncbi:MAG: Rieske (2Fe-2S) protein [Chloroflexota bacterium]|nr:MAG: Rieske (2Fe-2S) protein [Chloroflexota bacterium]